MLEPAMWKVTVGERAATASETLNLSIDSLERTWSLPLSLSLPGQQPDYRGAYRVFPELPAKLNHAEFRGNNLLFDLERPVDLPRAGDPRGPRQSSGV